MSDLVRLVIGAFLLVIACWYCCSQRLATTLPGTAVTTPATTLAAVPASLEARLQGGKLLLSGVLPNVEVKNRLLARAKELYGADGITEGTLRVSGPGVGNIRASAGWLDWTLELLPLPKKLGPEGALILFTDEVTVHSVLLDQAARSAVLQEVTAVLPGNVKLNDLTTITGNTLNEVQLKTQSDLNKILLKGIEFATGKDDLSTASTTTLLEAVAALNAVSDVKVEIGGHTDNVGNAAANNALSLARAHSVKKFLIGQGIAPDRLTAKGYGQTQPIADNASESGKQRNRRIEFRILSNNTQDMAPTSPPQPR
jgi:OmpA-OmpF porin, OOP family